MTTPLPAPLERYHADGYTFPLRVIDSDKAASYRRRLEASQAALGGRFSGIYTQKPHLLFTWLAELASEPGVLDLVEKIIGPDILLWSTEFFIKQPGDGRYVPWHVDDTYWHIEPEIQTTVWIALSDVGPDNGPLRYIPGSHLEARRPIVSAPSADNMLISGQMAQGIDETHAVDVLLRAGEASIHDSRALHASGRNTGRDARVGIAARYIATSVRSTAMRESALLVRGVDRHGHFDPEPYPRADLDEAARAAHAHAVELRNRNMYGADHKEQPAMKA
ncbi:phytanoyl-CoA dioxygenase family protein [Hydrogenophaga sp.]|uniref:phytanoyl-CoA dioxygenase family protein n=1 Tax=Hydrogenophaga sp. TaxID=1904254 RepID=UPI002622CE02|nr:phytanoyl-CoA dioxygenase family protein [Hydrogenophaga sp.]MCW5655821.1 phytanoyl-CoA dioxygenase family protein [Hydrogenophaga sp.]